MLHIPLDQPGETLSPGDLRRRDILRAARRCFARAGFHGASMGQICAEAQMSPGALYRYFPSKDAIIGAIAEEKHLGANACMQGLFGEGSLLDRMTLVSMDYFRSSRDDESGGLMIEISSESLRNTAVGARFHEIEGEVRGAFRRALEAAQETGELGRDIEIEIVLTTLMGTGSGLHLRMQFEPLFEVDRLEPYIRRMLAGLLRIEP